MTMRMPNHSTMVGGNFCDKMRHWLRFVFCPYLYEEAMMMERDEALCHCNVGQKLTLPLKSMMHRRVCNVMTTPIPERKRLFLGILPWRRPCNALKAKFPRLPLTMMHTWPWDRISVPSFALRHSRWRL
jgi:hypothetical protein